MNPLRLLVAYDGTDFSGFAAQPGQRTVQGELEGALSQLAQREIRIRVAGRTDAGVHALGQVVSIDDAEGLHPDMVVRAMPSLLPSDVAVSDAQVGPVDFDARRSAFSRSYVYLLWCSEVRNPLYRRYTWWMRERVDACKVNEALSRVVGTNDFSSFGRVREGQTPVRTVLDASCVEDAPFIRVRVTGASFLHQMVRSLVGTAVEVGAGRKPSSWMSDVLAARSRSVAGPVAPPHGLALVDVRYADASWPRSTHVGWPWSDVAASLQECVGGLG